MTAKQAPFYEDVPEQLAALTFTIDFAKIPASDIPRYVRQLQDFLQGNSLIKKAIKPRSTESMRTTLALWRNVAADTPDALLKMVNSYDFAGLKNPMVKMFRKQAEQAVETYIRKNFPTR